MLKLVCVQNWYLFWIYWNCHMLFQVHKIVCVLLKAHLDRLLYRMDGRVDVKEVLWMALSNQKLWQCKSKLGKIKGVTTFRGTCRLPDCQTAPWLLATHIGGCLDFGAPRDKIWAAVAALCVCVCVCRDKVWVKSERLPCETALTMVKKAA